MHFSKSPNDPITNDEIFFRRIIPGRYYYLDNILHISPTAFDDPYKQPSVDRALLCNNNPKHTQLNSANAVACLVAGEVREEKLIADNKIYSLNIKAKPTKNIAHSIIVGIPNYKNRIHFLKAQKSLTRLAAKRKLVVEPN